MSYTLRQAPDVKCSEGVAAAFVTTGGDTVGVVEFLPSGKFRLHRNGEQLGDFSTMGMMCRALDRVEA